jgi:hypothetical protein
MEKVKGHVLIIPDYFVHEEAIAQKTCLLLCQQRYPGGSKQGIRGSPVSARVAAPYNQILTF